MARTSGLRCTLCVLIGLCVCARAGTWPTSQFLPLPPSLSSSSSASPSAVCAAALAAAHPQPPTAARYRSPPPPSPRPRPRRRSSRVRPPPLSALPTQLPSSPMVAACRMPAAPCVHAAVSVRAPHGTPRDTTYNGPRGTPPQRGAAGRESGRAQPRGSRTDSQGTCGSCTHPTGSASLGSRPHAPRQRDPTPACAQALTRCSRAHRLARHV